MKYLSISVIALAVTLTACSLLGDAGNDPPDVLRPLAVGNWWEYEIRRPQWTNPIQDAVREVVSERVQMQIDGQPYTAWAWHVDIDFSPLPEYKWLARNGEGGLYKMGGVAETHTFFVNELSYKYPASVGETWEVPQLSFPGRTLSFTSPTRWRSPSWMMPGKSKLPLVPSGVMCINSA